MPNAPSRRTVLSRLGSVTRAWRKAEDGATAVEFGLVAVPFFGALFIFIQLAYVFWSTQLLEVAVATASRQLYTGVFQSDPNNKGLTASQLQEKFKKLVCDGVVALFDCTNNVSVDVKVFVGFNGAGADLPVKNGVYDATGYSFQSPDRNDVAVVRASMVLPTFAAYFTPDTMLANGNHLVMATAAFRTEPF